MTEIDKRIAVVAAILGQEWRQKHFDADDMARAIVAALDQRELITKWEGARLKVLEDYRIVHGWIPHDDLLDYLNKLPGAPLIASVGNCCKRADQRDNRGRCKVGRSLRPR